MKLRVILAIAWRDLAQQLRGRRGWVLPFIAALLLVPLATVPTSFSGPPEAPTFLVSGDVPDEVRALEQVRVGDRAGLAFEATDDGLLLHGPGVPDAIRSALDGNDAEVAVRHAPAPEFPLPGRTLLLTLIAASILTGAVSESIAGERGRKTLEALLSAAVTRTDIVIGKWLAWAGFGVVAACAAAVVAAVSGRVELGWWWIALPTVPMGTVALGMYLTRRARDVVGGATVSLRVLPAVLSVLGIAAWFTGLAYPEVGAAVPLGGALVAAGNTWPGVTAPLIASASTLLCTGLLLWGTARELERSAPTGAMDTGWLPGATAIMWTALLWWAAVAGPVLWGLAGNETLSRGLPVAPGLLAAGVGMVALLGVRAAGSSSPNRLLGLQLPPAKAWTGVAVGLILGAVFAWAGTRWLVPPPDLQALGARLSGGVFPLQEGVLIGLFTIAAQELLFRGYLQRVVGPIVATVAWVLIVCPVQPLEGALIGGCLAAVTWFGKGSMWPALAGRLLLGAIVAVGAV